jgi:hypothetical protein
MPSTTPQDQFQSQLATLHTEHFKLQAKLESCTGLRTLSEQWDANLQTRKEWVEKEIVHHEEWKRWKEKQKEMIDEKQKEMEAGEYEEKDQRLWEKCVCKKRTAVKQLERED